MENNLKQEPKFIISKEIVFEQLNLLKNIVNEVSYSWKTNPYVGEILNENESCYMSVHSIAELNQIKNKNKIWFFLMATCEETLTKLTKDYNLRNFVVDNLQDLNKLIKFIEKNNLKINLLLRMKLRENTLFTGKHYVFGMHLKEIKEQIDLLSQNKNIEKLGVHFHRKTQNVSEWNLRNEVLESLGDEYLSKIQIINIGGGLPGNYVNIHDRAIENIFMKISELKKLISKYDIELIAEPGRFIASPSVKLESNIIAIHDNNIFLDVSVFNGMLDTIVANVKLHIEGEFEKGDRYLLKGCTPDSCDILRYNVYLENPKVGQKIVFLNCGAYTYTTDFCALPKIKIEIVERF